MSILLKAAYVLLAVLLFTGIYLLRKKLIKENFFNEQARKRKNLQIQAENAKRAMERKYGEFENSSLAYKIDKKILMSGIRNRFPKFNVRTFTLILLILSLLGFGVGVAINKGLLFPLFFMIAFPVFGYIALEIAANHAYNRIEDTTALFVALLANHAKASSDIVTIMRDTYPEIDGPIKDLVGAFLIEADKTGDPDAAFDCMRELTRNRQLKTILMNLKNSSHYSADYEGVLAKMEGQLAQALSAREERKNILREMRISVVAVTLISAFIFVTITNSMDIDIWGIITENILGQGVVLLTGALYLFIVAKMFSTDEVNG